MTTSISLVAFETIEGLFATCSRRPALESIKPSDIRAVYFVPEWKLLDACIDAIGYDAANAFPSTMECAANILTDCYIGKCDVVDLEAA